LFIRCGIRSITALRAAIEQARKSLGDVGVLVDNAANDDRHTVEKVTVKDERMALNLRPMFSSASKVAAGSAARLSCQVVEWRSSRFSPIAPPDFDIEGSDLPINPLAGACNEPSKV
jgi:hypothetical protein